MLKLVDYLISAFGHSREGESPVTTASVNSIPLDSRLRGNDGCEHSRHFLSDKKALIAKMECVGVCSAGDVDNDWI